MPATKPRAYQVYDIDWKQAVRALSDSNINLASPGALVIDAVVLDPYDRVLLTAQTDATQNGIYQVNAAQTLLVPAPDWININSGLSSAVNSGLTVSVTDGAEYAQTTWTLTTPNPVIIGTTPINFARTPDQISNVAIDGTNIELANNASETSVSIRPSGTAGLVGITVPDDATADVANLHIYNLVANGNVKVSTAGGDWLYDTQGDFTGAGNVSAGYFLGNGTFLTGISALGSFIANGTSTVDIGTADGNVVVTTDGANAWTFDTAGNLTMPGSLVAETAGNTGSLRWELNGSNLNVLKLIPDDNLVPEDRYVVIDPYNTGHIHIRAGGIQDASNSYLYLGGEDVHVEVDDFTKEIRVKTYDVVGVSAYQFSFNNNGSFQSPNGIITGGNLSVSGNVSGQYFIGNGAFLTGISAGSSYSNANVANYLPTYAGNISGGNINFVNGSTIKTAVNNVNMNANTGGAVEITTDGGNYTWSYDNYGWMYLPQAQAAYTPVANGSVLFGSEALVFKAGYANLIFDNTGNTTTANYFLGNVQGLVGTITNLDSLNFTVQNISALVANNGVNIGAGGFNNLLVLPTDVLIQNVPLSVAANIIGVTANNNGRIEWIGNSSGDGGGYTTLTLTPDSTVNDQVLVLDPTAPGHIHLRAPGIGGNAEQPAANIFLGAENTNFEITAQYVDAAEARIHSAGNTWTFGNDGRLTFPGTPRIDTDQNNFEVQAAESINFEANAVVNIYTDTSGSGYQWQFGDDGRLTFPGTPRIDTDQNNFEVQAAESINFEANAVVNIYTDTSGSGYQWQFGDDGNFILPTNRSIIVDGGDGVIGPVSDDLVISWDNEDLRLVSVAGSIEMQADNAFRVQTNYDGANVLYASRWEFSNNELVNISDDFGIVSEVGNLTLSGGRDGFNSGNTIIRSVDLGVAVYDWMFDNSGNLTAPGNIIFADNYVYSGNRFKSPNSTVGNLNAFAWQFSDNSIGNDTITLQWNLFDTTTSQWYLSTDSQTNAWTLDSATKKFSYSPLNASPGSALTFGNAAANGTGAVNDIELTSSDSNVYIRANNSSWQFDNNGTLSAPGNITTTGNVSADYLVVSGGIRATGASPAPALSGFSSISTVGATGNITASGTLIANVGITTVGNVTGNYFFGNGSQLTGLSATYGNANVANFLAAFGSNTIVSTGNITAGNLIGNISITGNVQGTTPNVTLIAGSYNYVFDNAGNATLANGTTAVNNLSATGNITAGNIAVTDRITFGDATYQTTAWTGVANNYIALGTGAGGATQSQTAVAIGVNAGNVAQDYYTVAIGIGAARDSQLAGAIAIGAEAGGNSQGTNSISIGFRAGRANQANNSIVLNSTGANLNNTTANSFVVAPVRNTSGNAGILQYNDGTKEVSYSSNVTGNLNIIGGNISGNTAGYTLGYRDIPQVAFTGNATLSATDGGKHYYSTLSTGNTLTIANNSSVSWTIGTAITVVNRGTGNITIAQGTGVSLYLAGNSTAANRTVSSYGMASLLNVAANVWMINGTGIA